MDDSVPHPYLSDVIQLQLEGQHLLLIGLCVGAGVGLCLIHLRFQLDVLQRERSVLRIDTLWRALRCQEIVLGYLLSFMKSMKHFFETVYFQTSFRVDKVMFLPGS